MLPFSESVLEFGASFLIARARRALKAQGQESLTQEKCRCEWVKRAAGTEYGKLHGVEAGMSLADWRERVTLSHYESLAPYIKRMMNGEVGVLWPGRCDLFAVTSGTTEKWTKYLPVTREMQAHFRRAGQDAVLYYAVRTGGGAIFRGKHLLFGTSTARLQMEGGGEHAAYVAELSGIMVSSLHPWIKNHLCLPGREVAEMPDGEERVLAIAQRCVGGDITMLAGIPGGVLRLAEAVLQESARQGRPAATLKEVWPSLECVIHGGVPVGPYASELWQRCGEGVKLHEIYLAAEGFIAAQDAEPFMGLRLMTDQGIFYEFLPLADFDLQSEESLGAKAVTIAEVKSGVDYVLLLTTSAGLCRYVLGDVVRFISTEPPRLVYVGRTELQLSMVGERVSEKELTDVLSTVCRRQGWQVVNFHVAPKFGDAEFGSKRGCHEWWLELRPGTEATPTGPVIAAQLDAELQLINPGYAARRIEGRLGEPLVRLVMPGIFEHWQRGEGRWGGQQMILRCRGDREIADALAKLTRFYDSD